MYGYFIAVTIVVVVVSSLVANGITNGIIAQAARYVFFLRIALALCILHLCRAFERA